MGRSPSFAGVILAAGDSTRMGQDKALLPWQGGTFLSAAIDMLKPVTELVIVVGGKNTNSLLPRSIRRAHSSPRTTTLSADNSAHSRSDCRRS